MVTILKVGDTAIQLTGWIAWPLIVFCVASVLIGVAMLVATLLDA